MRYTIEKCTSSDICAAMDFFGENHDAGHVLAANRRFVDWQYYVPETDNYNILTAKDESGILGLFAYIPNTFFDCGIPHERKFIWTANWLAKKDHKGFAGLDLLYSMPKLENCENLGVVGLTAEAGKFYQKTGYRVGKLRQYFFVNRNVDEFRVLSVESMELRAKNLNADFRGFSRIWRIKSMSGFRNSPLISEYFDTAAPYKSLAFFENKYIKNPFYKYFAYGIEAGGGLAAIIICRVVSHNGANVVRLVEYAGCAEYLADASLQDILDEHDAEYLDFYCAGIPHELLIQAGFLLNTGDFIIPNYFEPFQNTNVEIAYAYKFPECYIFKGDGDRDHPRNVN